MSEELRRPQSEEEQAGMSFVLNVANDVARRLWRAEKAVNEDEKSGLATETRWRSELARSVESLNDNDTVVVMVGDLNGFKAVNDALGHQAGDELLGIVGEACKQTFSRSSDHLSRGTRDASVHEQRGDIARLGGDEFGFFSVIKEDGGATDHKRSNSATDMVQQQSVRLNQAITALTEGTKFEAFKVSMAIGGVSYDPDLDKTPADTFVRADAKMFEVKYKDKIDRITEEDKIVLRRIIPYLEGLGARVEDWLKSAVS